MASQTIEGKSPICKAAQEAYFDASCSLDSIGMDLERVSETCFALATSEAFEENAKHSFFLVASKIESLRNQARKKCSNMMKLVVTEVIDERRPENGNKQVSDQPLSAVDWDRRRA